MLDIRLEITVTDYAEIIAAVEALRKIEKEHSCNCTLLVKKVISCS